MTSNELFHGALQRKGSPWRVLRSDLSGDPLTLEIGLDFARGSQFRCPGCGELCGAYDTVQKRWRHLFTEVDTPVQAELKEHKPVFRIDFSALKGLALTAKMIATADEQTATIAWLAEYPPPRLSAARPRGAAHLRARLRFGTEGRRP